LLSNIYFGAIFAITLLGAGLAAHRKFYAGSLHFLSVALILGLGGWLFPTYTRLLTDFMLIFGFVLPALVKICVYSLAFKNPQRALLAAKWGKLTAPFLISDNSVKVLHCLKNLNNCNLADIEDLSFKLTQSHDPYDAFYLILLKIRLQDFNWLHQQLTDKQIAKKPVFLSAKVRALGELGFLSDMIQTLKTHDKKVSHFLWENEKRYALFFIAAFTGDTLLWQRLKPVVFKGLDADRQYFWQATYNFATAQDLDAYEAELKNLRSPDKPDMLRAIEAAE
jgi:hypothetical protein